MQSPGDRIVIHTNICIMPVCSETNLSIRNDTCNPVILSHVPLSDPVLLDKGWVLYRKFLYQRQGFLEPRITLISDGLTDLLRWHPGHNR